eukprot:TRINITY_DN3862_c0_g1_i1.p1 TRINITY_DN3862_c0_g1~~TRINITY_DN3862_c0_g1_i1.p1  ORF type:complete len:1182 (+),score=408.10 TRINITY_DN3862_c0_g1_i1:67-3546(+)
MGKKGKVELKKKRQQYFAQKKKAAKHARKERLRSRKPLTQDLKNIQEGIEEMIREGGAEPTPLAYYMCLVTILRSKPDPKRLPYFLALLDMYMGEISVGVLQKQSLELMELTATLLKQYLADMLIIRKGMQVIKTLFYILKPTRAMFVKLHSMEPNKLQSDHMPIYLRTLQGAMISAHDTNPELLHDLFLPFIKSVTNCFSDTQENVANSAARAIKSVLERTMSLSFIVKKPERVTKLLWLLNQCLQDMQYRNCWDLLSECIAVMLSKLALCRSTVKLLEEFPIIKDVMLTVDKLRMLDDFHYNVATETALGAAVRCMTAEEFLSVLKLDAFDMDPVTGRHYLLPVMRKNISHDHLAFFVKHFAPLIVQCRSRADEALLAGKHLEKKTLQSIHAQLWDLLPGFATFPQDLNDGGTYKVVAKELTGMLKDQELCKIACKTFVMLIEKSRYLAEYEPEMEEEDEEESDEEGSEGYETGDEVDKEKEDDDKMDEGDNEDEDEDSMDAVEQVEAQLPELLGTDFCEAPPEEDPLAFHMISKEKAQNYLEVLGQFSKNIIPLVCNAIEQEKTDRRVLLLSTLRSYASVAEKVVLNNMFKHVCKTLINAKDGEQSLDDMRKNQMMMDIGCVLGEYLDVAALDILMDIIEPLLVDKSEDALLQKKSYKALARIARTRSDVIQSKTDRIEGLLAQSQEHANSASKRERIQCMIHMACIHADNDEDDKLKAFVGGTVSEVMLALKEVNTRTRDTAFMCLASYAELVRVNNFTSMLFAGLAATTPSAVSCTIITLGKVLHEYHEDIEYKLKETLIKSCFMFIKHKSNEIKNAAMSFTRLALKLVRPSEEVKTIIEQNLNLVVDGCVTWSSQKYLPGNTRRNVKLILERCIKRFGYGYMLSIFPTEHLKLLEYVEKERKKDIKKAIRERELRKNKSAEQRKAKFNDLFFRDEKKEKLRMQGGEGDTMDLLDDNVMKRFVTAKSSTVLDTKDKGKEDGFRAVLNNGRLMVQSDAEYKRDLRQKLLDEKLSNAGGKERNAFEELGGGILSKKRRRGDDDDEGDVNPYGADEQAARNELHQLQVSLGKARPARTKSAGPSKRQRVEKDVRTGSQYRAKSGGDVKKGGTDPFAYVPLNAKYLNKRHRMKSISRVAIVDETAKKGAKARSSSKRR